MLGEGLSAARAVNAMTANWAEAAVGEAGTVLTAAGVWPALALLADAADGPARRELEAALGTGADSALAQGRGLLAALAELPGVGAALGLWTRAELPLRPEWPGRLPLDTHGTLTGDAGADLERMSAWAARHTDGLIEKMPPVVDPDTLLVLATALVVRTTWRRPFDPSVTAPRHGPWAGRTLAGLVRIGPLADELGVAHTPDGPLTVLRVDGEDGLDVHLLLGAEGAPGGQVLRAGVAAVGGAYPTTPGEALPLGTPAPGLTVGTVRSRDHTPALRVTAVPFTVNGEHDLLDHAPVFGLGSARSASSGHFPGISAVPLAISAARQSATATFGALGFRAAAVTALAAAPGGVPTPPPYEAKLVHASFDRPFGFLAVHRASGLVLMAGWVSEPEAYRDPFRPGAPFGP
ncbi:serpin family protein [Streptomyces sparsogenes]|uniref:Proteinase inhibitor I4 serpin n=1 Tax=Streptomyces sparsogenes DSM 40356 TaxID=1331668 RepID=A0A1R1SCD1_9ACTN|nr:serpin family protein [Streptomyces sparsogenes]OMI35920.1 proteinase inhibitor I4 serpin [Streptomyces sparsogenes DSM 40356]